MDFNFCSWQHPRKTILILFCENRRVGGTTRLFLDISTVRKENLRPKYLKPKGIKGTCSLTDKQRNKNNIFTFRWLNKMTVQNKTMKCLSCLLVMLCHTTLFFMVYSECNINTNILFNKEMKTVTCMLNTTIKKINQHD